MIHLYQNIQNKQNKELLISHRNTRSIWLNSRSKYYKLYLFEVITTIIVFIFGYIYLGSFSYLWKLQPFLKILATDPTLWEALIIIMTIRVSLLLGLCLQ